MKISVARRPNLSAGQPPSTGPEHGPVQGRRDHDAMDPGAQVPQGLNLLFGSRYDEPYQSRTENPASAEVIDHKMRRMPTSHLLLKQMMLTSFCVI